MSRNSPLEGLEARPVRAARTISRPSRGEKFFTPRVAAATCPRACAQVKFGRLDRLQKLFGGCDGLALPARLPSGRRANALAGGRQRAARALGRPPRVGLARLVRGGDGGASGLRRGATAGAALALDAGGGAVVGVGRGAARRGLRDGGGG